MFSLHLQCTLHLFGVMFSLLASLSVVASHSQLVEIFFNGLFFIRIVLLQEIDDNHRANLTCGGGAPLRVQVSRGEGRSWWALDRVRSEGSEDVDIFLLLSFDQDHVDESSL